MATQTLTDQELVSALKKSHLASKDKKAIEPLIAKMDVGDRQELMELIGESATVEEKVKKMKSKRDEALRSANREFKEATGKVVRESIGTARSEFEKRAKADEDQELENLQNQIGNL